MEIIVLVGRVLFSMLFIMSGISHFTQRAQLVPYAKSSGAPAPGITVPLTGLMLLAGGMSVLLGAYARLGAVLLALFLLPTAVIMHRFWGLRDQGKAADERAHFSKDVSLAGAALMIAYLGSGPYSVGP
jgi:putative oxidoreductase